MARSAFGTLLKIGDGGGSETFATIGEVRDISGPAMALGTEEVTSHDSASGWREYVPTLLEGGEISFSINFTAASTQGFSSGLFTTMTGKTLRNFQLVVPTASAKTASFAAYVTQWNPNLPVEGAITADITLQVSGPVTWA